jgi:glycosyltransferase involved in cell wall biosynthesis
MSTDSPRTQPLRVLQVTPRFFPFMGGIETHVHEVGRRLVRAGVDLTVLTTNPDRTLEPESIHEGMRIKRAPAWPAQRDYYFAPEIYRTVLAGGWDIVHLQGCHTLVAPTAMLAARRAGIPYVVTFHTGGHSSGLRTALRGAQWSALRPLFAGATRLIGVSEFEAETFRERLRLPRQRFTVIPNGGAMQDFEPPIAPLRSIGRARAQATRGEDAVIVSIGRLERYKGHQRVIAALPKVLDHWPKARLLILGAGPYEAALRRLAARLGVAERVEIRSIPASDRDAMARTLSGAALVTLLSDYEAHPIAVMEALAMRRPVLVTETSGLRQFAEQGLARSVALRSTPDEVAAAILDQLQEPLVPAQIALPTWEECAAAVLDVYQSAAGRIACAS